MNGTEIALAGVSVVAFVAVVACLRLWLRGRSSRRRIAALVGRLEDPEKISAIENAPGFERALTRLERAVDMAALRDTNRTVEQRRLLEALKLLREGFVVADDAGHIVYANQAARRWLGGRHVDAIVDNRIRTLMQRTLDASAALSDELELVGPPSCTLELTAAPLDNGEKYIGAVCFVLDRTEARRVDAVRRDFVANISHELKTPVSALGLLAETLRDALDDPEIVRRLSDRLVHESSRLVRIIDDLLALSRLETEGSPVRESTSVDLIVADAVERVRAGEVDRRVDIRTDVAPGLRLVCDRRQLTSAVYNLLENAVKYSETNARVEVRARDAAGGVAIEVQDHGIGIPRQEVDRIFERFYRVDRARSRDTGGTGLGLAIVRHAVANHGGKIDVESVPGEGSTFAIRLPASPDRLGAGDAFDTDSDASTRVTGFDDIFAGVWPDDVDSAHDPVPVAGGADGSAADEENPV